MAEHEKKILASILKFEPRTNSDMVSFLAFANYFSNSMNNISGYMKLLRDGIRVDSPNTRFMWNSKLVEAFKGTREQIADIMSSPTPGRKRKSPDSLKNITRLAILNHLDVSKEIPSSEVCISKLDHNDLPESLIEFLKGPRV